MNKSLSAIAALLVSTLSWESTYAAVLPNRNPSRDFRAEDFLTTSSSLREQLNRSLDDPTVVAELQRRGVKRAEVEHRLAGMTDRELDQIAKNVQRQVGGDTVILSTTTVLLLIIIVLLIVIAA